MGGENIVDEPGTRTGNFIRRDGRSHAAAAEGYSTVHLSGGDRPGEGDDEVGVVIFGVHLMCAEVHDLVSRATQRLRYLPFQGKASMVRCDSHAHHGFSLTCRIKLRVVESVIEGLVSVKADEVFGLVGSKGAGKTTTINMLTTLSPLLTTFAITKFELLKTPRETGRKLKSGEASLNDLHTPEYRNLDQVRDEPEDGQSVISRPHHTACHRGSVCATPRPAYVVQA